MVKKGPFLGPTMTNTSTLPLNQEGILSTQFSALVFFSVSTGSSRHLHLQVFLVFKSSSLLCLLHLLHLQVIFFFKYFSSRDLHHNDYQIIIAGSSSLDMDHHQVWIIITYRSSLDLDHHHVLSQNGDISILLITGSSTESVLQAYPSCRSSSELISDT